MYTSWFYYILTFITMMFIFRLIGPFIIPIAIIYMVYTAYKNRQRIKAMKDLHDASKMFKDEWDQVKQSQEYQSTSKADDVIDAHYTIKEESE